MGRALEYGMVAINTREDHGAPIPFAASKQSGIPRRSRHGLEAFTDLKTFVWIWRKPSGIFRDKKMLEKSNELSSLDRTTSSHPSTHMGTHARGESTTPLWPAAKASRLDNTGKKSIDAFAGLLLNVVMAARRSPTRSRRRRRPRLYSAYVGMARGSITLAKMIIDRAPKACRGSISVSRLRRKRDQHQADCITTTSWDGPRRRRSSRAGAAITAPAYDGSLTGLELFHNAFDLPGAPVLHTRRRTIFRRADRR